MLYRFLYKKPGWFKIGILRSAFAKGVCRKQGSVKIIGEAVGFMEGKTGLLFVEDDLIVLDDLLTIVSWQEAGYEAFSAVNGRQGIERYMKYRPQIIVTDVKMPLLDGLEMMKEIRKENPYVQFMILSSYKDFAYLQDAIRLGAKDYISKTAITGQLLLDKVNGLRQNWETGVKNSFVILKGMLSELVQGIRKDTLQMETLCGYFSKEEILEPFIEYAGRELGWDFPGDESVFAALENRYCHKYPPAVSDAIDFICKNYARPELSNGAVAAEMGMSERRFTELFKAETGRTVNDFITEIRMEEAKKLLKNGYRVYETASLTGYSSAQYFGTVFKNYTGITPKDYQGKQSSASMIGADVQFQTASGSTGGS